MNFSALIPLPTAFLAQRVVRVHESESREQSHEKPGRSLCGGQEHRHQSVKAQKNWHSQFCSSGTNLTVFWEVFPDALKDISVLFEGSHSFLSGAGHRQVWGLCTCAIHWLFHTVGQNEMFASEHGLHFAYTCPTIRTN